MLMTKHRASDSLQVPSMHAALMLRSHNSRQSVHPESQREWPILSGNPNENPKGTHEDSVFDVPNICVVS